MGIINIVKNAKDVHKDYIVLVKVGNFYNCYGRDAYIISYLLDYKITLVDNNIYNCSFPKSAYNKVISIIENNKVNYIVLDKRNNYDVEDVLGDLIISIPKVKEQAVEYGHSFDRELAYMVVHGFYHLMGYDHMEEDDKKEMRQKEDEVLNKLGITRD